MSIQTSVISDNLVLYGKFEVQSDLRVDGFVIGNIHCKGAITIGESAHVDGEITAETIYCDGKIYGTVEANQIYLNQNSVLIGKVQTSLLEMQKESHFEGEIEIREKK
jgi:cytoskeletal protein CcmA (bactofilin family)